MKQRLRTVIFWMHLCTGLAAGSIVAVMSVTGVALAFQPQILEWAERGSRTIDPPPAAAVRLGTEELLARYRAAHPEAPATALTFHADPLAAVRVGAGRGGAHVDPYTGQVRPLGGQGWRRFFQVMVEWHRYLGASGEGRDIGKAITGVANAGFLFLALSGLYLWWPRRWTARILRSTIWFRRGLASSKARDFNWHNVIGFWSLPVLIVVTFSGMMISYRFVTNLIYAVVGESAPAAGPGGAAGPPVKVAPPVPGQKPLGTDALLATMTAKMPDWKSAVWRLGGERRGAGGGGRRGPQPVTLTVKEYGQWPLFTATTLSLDPFTGQVLRTEGYAEYSTGRRVRSWLRFLHTGEALGWPGQLVAGLVSLGAAFLVWTGFALAWRRLFGRRGVVTPEVEGVMPGPGGGTSGV